MCLHEQIARGGHGPLLSPAGTLKGVTEGTLPQHGLYQDLKHRHRHQDVEITGYSELALQTRQ